MCAVGRKALLRAGTRPEARHCGPYGTPEQVEALARQFRHALLAPWAVQPTPDPRLLGWRRPATMTPARDVCLAYATSKDTRLTLIALAYAEPRAFARDGRLAPLLAGLCGEQRRQRLAAIASGITHSVIPPEESHHLCVTVHHGHLQGQNKCRGDKGLCARCLALRGERHEETVLHEYHDCPEAKAVWAKVAADWLEATGDALDAGSPLLTVTGLRLPTPGGLSAGALLHGSAASCGQHGGHTSNSHARGINRTGVAAEEAVRERPALVVAARRVRLEVRLKGLVRLAPWEARELRKGDLDVDCALGHRSCAGTCPPQSPRRSWSPGAYQRTHLPVHTASSRHGKSEATSSNACASSQFQT